MKNTFALLAASLALAATGAAAQTRTYRIHFDGSCAGLTLHVTNYRDVVAQTVGCGDAGKIFMGRIGRDNIAHIVSADAADAGPRLNYAIGLKDQTWALTKTEAGKMAALGDGKWTKQQEIVPVEDVAAK